MGELKGAKRGACEVTDVINTAPGVARSVEARF
jgi:hypothetical protein